ncbi:ribosomal protein S18 acetylase RimI-like enzyme [Roseibium hamelinense]|uniref:Ribosomal protein S18 acetylase RimI-like enzyme n=2 Tax=Roseibium hamelinense TaxID=150831 RepID=A0A562TJT6_9HYPH|nr:ribosomal protein S18 acetylase RimI-like enzyme [Roseibium hamelinense]
MARPRIGSNRSPMRTMQVRQTRGQGGMEFYLRRLAEADLAVYKALRLEALRDHPDAFGTSFEEAVGLPDTVFEQQLRSNLILGGGFEEERFDAFAGFVVPPEEKVRHKGIIWGVYARPEVRRAGLAKALIQTIIDAVQGGIEQIQLSVGAGNGPAERLYRSLGFEPYGLEKNALKTGGRYIDEILMVLHMRQD